MSVGTSEEIREVWLRFIETLDMTPGSASRWIVDQGVPISAAGARGWLGLDSRDPSAPRDPDVEDAAGRLVARVLGAEDAGLLIQLWAVRRALQRIEASDLSELDELFNLGVLYDERDDAEHAEKWYLQAAEHGHTLAMNNLGVINQERGRLDDAEKWYLMACEGEHGTAMGNLAVLYRERREMAKAEEWLIKASELGNERATSNLAALYVELGEQKKARQWLAKHDVAATG